MALKTRPTEDDVAAFLAAIPDERRRVDSEAVCRLMAEETGEAPVLWGTAIVGFGRFMYRVRGRARERVARRRLLAAQAEPDACTSWTASRATRTSSPRLGRHSTGKSCLYIKRLEEIDTDVLREMVRTSYRDTLAR